MIQRFSNGQVVRSVFGALLDTDTLSLLHEWEPKTLSRLLCFEELLEPFEKRWYQFYVARFSVVRC